MEDLAEKQTYGVQCLLRFYSYGLEKSFRPALFEDFQTLVWERYQEKDLYGLEKLVAFLTYSESKPLLHRPLQELVDTKYPTLEAFAQ